MPCSGLFITGTDTDVGKTYLTSLIGRDLHSQGVKVGACKPVCSGSETGPDGKTVWHDVEELFRAVGGEFDRARICPQRFFAPLAPPVAARLEGKTVDRDLLRTGVQWWYDKVDILLVEGVGGFLCPLTESETVADLARDLNFPLLIVARLGLGTINHTLLTVEAAKTRGLPIAGIILNCGNIEDPGVSVETNPAEIADRCDVPVLGLVGRHQSTGLLRDGIPIKIDWQALAGG